MLIRYLPVGAIESQVRGGLNPPTCWRHSFRMCPLRHCVREIIQTCDYGTDTRIRWLVYKIVDIIRHYAHQHYAVIATGVITNLLVIISVLSAFPWIRKSVSQPPYLAMMSATNCYPVTIITYSKVIIGLSAGWVLRYLHPLSLPPDFRPGTNCL